KRRRTQTARGVVVAAGPLGTNLLLQNCKHSGSLAGLSDRLGSVVRTNSEAITCVTAKDDKRDFADSIAITSSIYPDEHTHIENVTYGRGADSMSMLFALMTGDGNKLTRPVRFLGQAIRHPFNFARSIWPGKWSRRTLILLVMQTVDSSMKLIPKKKLLGTGIKLQTEQDPLRPNPTFIPVANLAAEWVAKSIGGVPQSGITEVLFNTPTTAHILGGAVIGRDRQSGVIDDKLQVFGYRNLLVTDGAAISANIGVNPSLTITAQAEHAMTNIPPAPGAEDVTHIGVEEQAAGRPTSDA
ncbi:MAG: GMC oxidoreductase, partial [Solirubrobacterales bacterium]